jgi:hypothetical protein
VPETTIESSLPPLSSTSRPSPQQGSLDTRIDMRPRPCSRSLAVFQRTRRLQKPAVGPSLSDPAERAVAQLIACVLSVQDVNFDSSLSRRSCGILPRYMLGSEALHDAVKCMIASCSNHRQGLAAQDLFDLKSYGRALRSLHQALRNPGEQTSASTLAAVSIMHRIVVRCGACALFRA